jgi:urease accessory protein UreE
VLRRLENPEESTNGPACHVALPLTWMKCRRRNLRETLPDGRTIRLLLSPGVILQHGDVVFEDSATLVWVSVVPCKVIVATTADAGLLTRAAYEIGNLHAPIELEPGRLITLPDGPVEGVLRQYEIAFSEDLRRFNPMRLPNGVSFQLADDFQVIRASD